MARTCGRHPLRPVSSGWLTHALAHPQEPRDAVCGCGGPEELAAQRRLWGTRRNPGGKFLSSPPHRWPLRPPNPGVGTERPVWAAPHILPALLSPCPPPPAPLPLLSSCLPDPSSCPPVPHPSVPPSLLSPCPFLFSLSAHPHSPTTPHPSWPVSSLRPAVLGWKLPNKAWGLSLRQLPCSGTSSKTSSGHRAGGSEPLAAVGSWLWAWRHSQPSPSLAQRTEWTLPVGVHGAGRPRWPLQKPGWSDGCREGTEGRVEMQCREVACDLSSETEEGPALTSDGF